MEHAAALDPAPASPSANRPALRVLPRPDAERLATLGMATASVAHELGGPISCVVGNLGLVVAGLAEAAAAGRALGPADLAQLLPAARDALDGAERMRAIAGDLRQIGRGDEGPLEAVDVARAMERALAMARPEVREHARVARAFLAAPPVAAREGRLVQVLCNLIVNAAHAIPTGAADRQQITLACAPGPDGWVELSVADTGCGIPSERLPLVFEPFFTTKRERGGSGLGLFLCRAFVTELRGTIAVESVVGQGTVVRVRLPAWTGGHPQALR